MQINLSINARKGENPITETALVTGATGFVGSHLCRLLLETGYRVQALHRPASSLTLLQGLDVERIVGDVTRPETLYPALKGVDVVFHTASRVDYWRGADGMYQVTVEGTWNVLQAALEAGARRVVYTSSVAALGVPAYPCKKRPVQPVYLNENHVWNYKPRWWRYGHAKYLAEQKVQWAVARGLDVVIVNPAMILGPGDVNRISGELVILMSRGIVPFSIAGGMNAIHVDDVARGHLLALERGSTGERYILGGENLTYLEMFQLTAEIAGMRPPTVVIPAGMLRPFAGLLDFLCHFVPLPFNGDLLRFAGRFLYYDTSKAQRVLGLKGLKPIRTAIQETWDWYYQQGWITRRPGG